MLIYIDESGDAGFKLTQGSSKCLVICLVCFSDSLERDRTDVAIKELRRTLKWPDHIEFKFSKSKADVRAQFLSKVAKYDFKITALVVQKDRIRSEFLRTSKAGFYNYAVRNGLASANDLLEGAKIYIDGSGDRVFKQELNTYLRRETAKHFHSFQFVKKSQNNQLIQMADMCAGAINRAYSREKPDSQMFYDIIRRKVVNVWDFK